VLVPDVDPAGALISAGGCLDMGIDGEVGETCEFFSLPGPTLPGSMLSPPPGACGGTSVAESARTGAAKANVAATAKLIEMERARMLHHPSVETLARERLVDRHCSLQSKRR
jgi:hypothetical protein